MNNKNMLLSLDFDLKDIYKLWMGNRSCKSIHVKWIWIEMSHIKPKVVQEFDYLPSIT